MRISNCNRQIFATVADDGMIGGTQLKEVTNSCDLMSIINISLGLVNINHKKLLVNLTSQKQH